MPEAGSGRPTMFRSSRISISRAIPGQVRSGFPSGMRKNKEMGHLRGSEKSGNAPAGSAQPPAGGIPERRGRTFQLRKEPAEIRHDPPLHHAGDLGVFLEHPVEQRPVDAHHLARLRRDGGDAPLDHGNHGDLTEKRPLRDGAELNGAAAARARQSEAAVCYDEAAIRTRSLAKKRLPVAHPSALRAEGDQAKLVLVEVLEQRDRRKQRDVVLEGHEWIRPFDCLRSRQKSDGLRRG